MPSAVERELPGGIVDRRASAGSTRFPELMRVARQTLKGYCGLQRPTEGRNVLIFSTPRSGSTWLQELFLSQPRYRACNEPLNLRNPYVRRHLGISDWVELQSRRAEPKLAAYFRRICDGQVRGLCDRPFTANYRFYTDRLAFKIIHGCEDRIAWLQNLIGGKVVLLIRHPIAVTVSRRELPRLFALLNSDYRSAFSKKELALAASIAESGSWFEKGVLHWCLENAIPLRNIAPDWIVVCYEQLVLQPEPIIDRLATAVPIDDVERVRQRLGVPSRVMRQSDAITQTLVRTGSRSELTAKWRTKVTPEQEKRAFEIVQSFGIDAYSFGSDLPREKYLLS